MCSDSQVMNQWAKFSGQRAQRSSYFYGSSAGIAGDCPASFACAQGLNSDSHACTAVTLPTELSHPPETVLFSFPLYLFNAFGLKENPKAFASCKFNIVLSHHRSIFILPIKYQNQFYYYLPNNYVGILIPPAMSLKTNLNISASYTIILPVIHFIWILKIFLKVFDFLHKSVAKVIW